MLANNRAVFLMDTPRPVFRPAAASMANETEVFMARGKRVKCGNGTSAWQHGTRPVGAVAFDNKHTRRRHNGNSRMVVANAAKNAQRRRK